MNREAALKHNRLFEEALSIVKDEIPLHGQSDKPVPGWILAVKLRRAIAIFERALRINPENWPAMWYIGKVHQRLRNPADALAWFEQAHQINPSQPDIVREASLCAMEIGYHDMAIVFAHRATQLEPTNPGLHANLALAYLLAGRVSDAETAVDRALTADPSDTISQTIRTMVQHFATSRRVPPTTTLALQNYWRQNRKVGC